MGVISSNLSPTWGLMHESLRGGWYTPSFSVPWTRETKSTSRWFRCGLHGAIDTPPRQPKTARMKGFALFVTVLMSLVLQSWSLAVYVPLQRNGFIIRSFGRTTLVRSTIINTMKKGWLEHMYYTGRHESIGIISGPETVTQKPTLLHNCFWIDTTKTVSMSWLVSFPVPKW